MGAIETDDNATLIAADVAATVSTPLAERRQNQIAKLDDLWRQRRPAPGDRAAFDAALLAIERVACRDLAVPLVLFERWAAGVSFEVDGTGRSI